jgi:hypothetical protein
MRATIPFLSSPITVMKSSSLSRAGCLKEHENRNRRGSGRPLPATVGRSITATGACYQNGASAFESCPAVIGGVTFAAGGHKADPRHPSLRPLRTGTPLDSAGSDV